MIVKNCVIVSEETLDEEKVKNAVNRGVEKAERSQFQNQRFKLFSKILGTFLKLKDLSLTKKLLSFWQRNLRTNEEDTIGFCLKELKRGGRVKSEIIFRV